MYTTYHFSSAQELNSDIIDPIKTAFQSKPITIIIEEDTNGYELTTEMKSVLTERVQEEESTYLTGKESIDQLKEKYAV